MLTIMVVELIAASASFPTKLPTTIESTVLYSIWKTFPKRRGSANAVRCPAIDPSVISRTVDFFRSSAFSVLFVSSGISAFFLISVSFGISAFFLISVSSGISAFSGSSGIPVSFSISVSPSCRAVWLFFSAVLSKRMTNNLQIR